MPNTSSAHKAMRQSERRRKVNSHRRDKYKLALRDFRKQISAGSKDQAIKAMQKAASAIDKAIKTHTVHANKASRLKSRMVAAVTKLK